MAQSDPQAPELKHFAVQRALQPGTTWQEMDAGAVQVLVNMFLGDIGHDEAYDPGIAGVRWYRSYWEPEGAWGLCLYEGTSAAQIERWNHICGTPFTEIREIDLAEPPAAVEYRSGFHADPSVSRLVALECPATVDARQRLAAHGIAGPVWIRSYVDPQRGAAVSLYQADIPDDAAVAALEAEGWKVRRVVEITPNDYVDIE